jgi:triacylglycerol lipase
MRRLAVFAIACSVALTVAAPAGATQPVPSPFPAAEGPPLQVPPATLAASLNCPGGFSHPEHEPVLLVHGTGATGELNWGWNYAKVLPTMGYDVCMVDLPNRALDDIQVSSEYVVSAIRTMARTSGRMVDVLGHSQGGIEPRWALKWWPDTQRLVDDDVMLASPNHGVYAADVWPPGVCTEACYQMRTTALFMAALNAGDETPGAVSYTSIYSTTDELVQPTTTASMNGAANIAIQDVCPGRPVEHASMAADAAAFALVMDAFTHPGPTDPGRVDRGVCAQGSFPGIDPLAGFGELAREFVEARSFPYHPVAGEPPLAPYARGGQQAAAQPPAAGNPSPAPAPGGSPPAGPTVSAAGGQLPATGGSSGGWGLTLVAAAAAAWLVATRSGAPGRA